MMSFGKMSNRISGIYLNRLVWIFCRLFAKPNSRNTELRSSVKMINFLKWWRTTLRSKWTI